MRTKKNKLNNFDPSNYSGVQLDARMPTSYGMYIFSGWNNIKNDPTVSGIFLQSMQPPTIFYPELAKLWRWTEFDWEYVPHTTATFMEKIECTKEFSNLQCKPLSVAGPELTDDEMATQIGIVSGHTDVTSWSELVQYTGQTASWNYWAGASQWQKPAAEYPPKNIPFHTINFWRMPEGTKQVIAHNIEANFIPNDPDDDANAAMTNENYVTMQDTDGKYFSPTEFHFYTIVWTPRQLYFYIDAGSDGKDIENTAPIKTFTYNNYPGISMTGDQQPGGDLTWWFYGAEKKLGDMLIMLNHYIDGGWGGQPTTDFKSASTFIRNVMHFPLDPDIEKAEKEGIFAPLKGENFIYKDNNKILDLDFSQNDFCNNQPQFWRYYTQKYFAPEVAGDFSTGKLGKNPTQMNLTLAPDGTQALELRVSSYDNPLAKQDFFYVVLDTPQANNNNAHILVTINSDPQDKGVGAYLSVTNTNTINMDVFWAPVGSELKVNIANLSTDSTEVCTITIGDNLTWKLESCDGNSGFLSNADAVASSNHGNQGRIPVHLPTTYIVFEEEIIYTEEFIVEPNGVIKDYNDEL
jgi:hypothetical protein